MIEISFKICNHHHIYFPEEDCYLPCTNEYFYKTETGWYPYCKKCAVKKSQEWKRNNPLRFKSLKNKYNKQDKYKEMKIKYEKEKRPEGYQKDYQNKNKDKIKKYNKNRLKKNHKVNKTEWENCKKYFNYKCAYCGLPLENHIVKFKGVYRQGDFHKEHVIDEGRNDLKNCVPSCESCNSRKNRKTLNQFYNKNNPDYTSERYYKIYLWLRYDCKKYIQKKRKR